MNDGIQTVTGDTFEARVLQGQGPIVVEFMSYGCAHCRVLEPMLQDVANTVRGREQIVRVNVAIEAELAETYAVQGTPTLVMFLDGTEVGRVDGPQPDQSSLLDDVTQPFLN